MTAVRNTASAAVGLDRTLVLLMAAATGFAIANIYYAQPVLPLIGHDLGGAGSVNFIPTATQIGYSGGIILLVPVGDRVDRRRLILAQCVGLTLALLSFAMATSAVLAIAASVAIGLFATIAQQIVPFAAQLSAPETRGRTVGTVMSGLLVGILSARTLSGVVAEWAGWRSVFWLGASLALAMAAMLYPRLPHSAPSTQTPYGQLIASLGRIVLDEPELRRAAMTQGLLFAGFSAFWTILAPLLAGAPYHLGSEAAGLFGLLAVGSVAVAPLAGRLADRRGPRSVVRVGTVVVLAAFLLMLLDSHLATLAIGVVVMDVGVQVAMIGNQATIYALAGTAPGRFNTIYIAIMFALGAVGSASASAAWSAAGWRAVMMVAAAAAACAVILQIVPSRRSALSQGVAL
ncbi:MFS transporter [Sphingomonas beigongshangi]|uniref:MFS transporter n=1 Tax=Sphingomonas beigongshangi TaxID=2782540 RepID=UPI001AEDB082|nr:MFS transporter [Sphingomonas beigongshangi]